MTREHVTTSSGDPAFIVTYTAIDRGTGEAQVLKASCVSEEAGRAIISDMVGKHQSEEVYKDYFHVLTLTKDGTVIHKQTDCA